jgi:hypothetical protein
MNSTSVDVWRHCTSGCGGRQGWSTNDDERSWNSTCGRRRRPRIWRPGRRKQRRKRRTEDGPDAEEHAAQQKASLESFESLKKVEDDTRARERWRRAVDLSIKADRRFSAEQRQCLREDRERRRAAYEKWRYDGAGSSNASPSGMYARSVANL